MSDLDNAINSINASAAKAENTATFLDDMSTFDDQSSVTNPNNGQTVASISKQVKDRTDELFASAESDINQAVSDAAQSATDAQDAADSIGRYQGLWPDSGGIANKGDTYQTQVSGTPTGQYFTALQNTTTEPVGDDVNWREDASKTYIDSENQLQDSNIASNSLAIQSVSDRVFINESDISALQAGQGSGVYGYATRADLEADLTPADQAIGMVTNDSTSTNNTNYRKVGASGVGSWTQGDETLAAQAYQKATVSEMEITELDYLADNTRIFDSLKSIRNEILEGGELNTAKNESSSTGFFSFFYDSDDYIIKRSGVSQFWSNSGVSPLSEFPATSIEGKTVLLGCFEYIDPDGGATPSTLAAANQKPTPTSSLESFNSDSSGFFQVSPNVRLLWNKGVVQSGMANGAYRVNLSSNTDGSKLQFGQFVAFGDSSIRWEDVDIFHKNEGNSDILEIGKYVQASVGTNSLIDFTASSGDAEPVDLKVAEDLVPNPYAWVLAPSDTGAFSFQYTFEDDQLNKRFAIVFYYYQPDDFEVGSKRLRDVSVDFVNGLSIVPTNDNSNISVKYENLADGLTKCSITGLFDTTLSTSYGLRVLTTNILTGSGDLVIFGALMHTMSEEIYHGQLTPKNYNSPTVIAPSAQNPAENVADTYFNGKKCVWIGTSIPASREYPQRVASRLNMSLVNLSQGGGRLGAYREDMVFDNNMKYNFMWSSQDSQTYYAPNIGQEVNPDNYSELQTGSGVVLTQDLIDTELENHYEFKLSPHSDADLVVVDYGINDRNLQQSSPWVTVSNSNGDPRYFTGAFTKLIEYLYSINPSIKVVVIGHYLETDTGVNDDTPDVIAAQKDCAKSYGLSFIDMQGNMNINPLNITTYAPDELHPTPGGDLDYRMYRYISSRLIQL